MNTNYIKLEDISILLIHTYIILTHGPEAKSYDSPTHVALRRSQYGEQFARLNSNCNDGCVHLLELILEGCHFVISSEHLHSSTGTRNIGPSSKETFAFSLTISTTGIFG